MVVGCCLSKNPLFTRYYKVLGDMDFWLKTPDFSEESTVWTPIHAVYIISISNNLANTKMP